MLSESLGINRGRLANEVGHVIGVDRSVVIGCRIGLWQHEWFTRMAVLVEMGQIQASVEPVVPAAAEYEPAGIVAPVMEALRVVAIHLTDWAAFACHEIKEPKIGLFMPDREIAVVGKGVHQVSPVVGGTGETDAFPGLVGIDKRIDLIAKSSCRWIEAYAAKAVADLFVFGGNRLCLSATKIEASAIWGEGGESLETVFLSQEVAKQEFVV